MTAVQTWLAASEATGPVPVQRNAVPSDKQFTFDIAVVGLGYVGLPTALAFHASGHRVLGVDVNATRLASIRSGAVDLSASDLSRLEVANKSSELELDASRLQLHNAKTVIICVPTPVDSYLLPDLVALRAACETVVAAAVATQTIILTSTTYVGSTRELLGGPLLERGLAAGLDVFVAFSPERIDPGGTARFAHEDVPRVVGGLTAEGAKRAAAALAGYATRVHTVSSAEAAEFTKLHENTFRAVKSRMRTK